VQIACHLAASLSALTRIWLITRQKQHTLAAGKICGTLDTTQINRSILPTLHHYKHVGIYLTRPW
jgi:hypothetical protein